MAMVTLDALRASLRAADSMARLMRGRGNKMQTAGQESLSGVGQNTE
jgi:hypothetical protein